MAKDITIAAYYYPGWHPCSVRDVGFSKGFSEWDLVYGATPRFDGHQQPNIPLWGREDESQPRVFSKKIDAAKAHGIDLFVFAFYWSRGKRLLEGALNQGFLSAPSNREIQFALMWANRMPRRVLPVKKTQGEGIDPMRLVYTDSNDFLDFIKHIATEYFTQPSYFRYLGNAYLSIFDTNFFLRQLGENGARAAIARARKWLFANGFGGLHLAAIDPIPQFRPVLQKIGFDSVTHYVLLPEWKGPRIQDFEQAARARAGQWPHMTQATRLPYFPAVSPGWDATPRAVDYGKEKPKRYPWSPIVVGQSPAKFAQFLKGAVRFSARENPASPMVFIASWNEWSEGHYLEPDTRYGYNWLEAVREAAS
ncbi:MAG: glycoside hydrolase family 99-like domain-containing protein [Myxococcota bacterium]|nr:glycoside hydrolase family 99-like domain-containing protein [Myxococcota bacterium]